MKVAYIFAPPVLVVHRRMNIRMHKLKSFFRSRSRSRISKSMRFGQGHNVHKHYCLQQDFRETRTSSFFAITSKDLKLGWPNLLCQTFLVFNCSLAIHPS
ncbi:hypothetical protein O6H91_Y138200 [Diphasiastrum complanatum]|nr:hypothetical protein O6H91_Y138200 [Diphasiastrum complanatum]